MNPQLIADLKKHLVSFAWRLGSYVVVAIIGFALEQLKLLPVSPTVVAVVGLVAGEVVKYVNNNVTRFGKS